MKLWSFIRLNLNISPGFRVLWSVVPCSRKLKNSDNQSQRKHGSAYLRHHFGFFCFNGPGGRVGGESSSWRWMLFSQPIAFLISLTILSLQYPFLLSLIYFVLSQEKTWLTVLSSLWMGHAMYFSLGNSNSLASIDVSAGYVGLENFVPGAVGPLMYVATYCGPILWLIAAVLSIVRDARDIKRSDCGTDILNLLRACYEHLIGWTGGL